MPHAKKFTPEQEKEVVALYLDPKLSTREIMRTYSMTAGHLARVLNRHKVPRRQPKQNVTRKVQPMPAPSTTGVSPANLTVNPLNFSTAAAPAATKSLGGMAITVDKQGYVIAAQREGEAAKLPCYDVTVEILMRKVLNVRAPSLEEAIHRAKTDPNVRRVVGVMESQPDA